MTEEPEQPQVEAESPQARLRSELNLLLILALLLTVALLVVNTCLTLSLNRRNAELEKMQRDLVGRVQAGDELKRFADRLFMDLAQLSQTEPEVRQALERNAEGLKLFSASPGRGTGPALP